MFPFFKHKSTKEDFYLSYFWSIYSIVRQFHTKLHWNAFTNKKGYMPKITIWSIFNFCTFICGSVEKRQTHKTLLKMIKITNHYFQSIPSTSQLSHVLRSALSSRFVDVLTSVDENADPFFMAAAFLDPTVVCMMQGYTSQAEKCVQVVVSFYFIGSWGIDVCKKLETCKIRENFMCVTRL